MGNKSTVTGSYINEQLVRAQHVLRESPQADPKQLRFSLLLITLWLLKWLSDNNDAHPSDRLPFPCPEELRWERWTSLPLPKIVEVVRAEEIGGKLNELDLEVSLRPIARLDESTWRRLVAVFSALPLRGARNQFPEALRQFLARTHILHDKRAGEMLTPKSVSALLARIMALKANMSISDPACGQGGLLFHCIHHLTQERPDLASTLRVEGQEMNPEVALLCRLYMMLFGLDEALIKQGNTLLDPKLLDPDGSLSKYDRVIVHPPFGARNWGASLVENDPHQRFTAGIPSKSHADLAFLQHVLATLKPGGLGAIVLSEGSLFRSAERKIRQTLLERDVIEAVIALPEGTFQPMTHVRGAIVVICPERRSHRGRILFVQTRDLEGIADGLQAKHIDLVARVFEAFDDRLDGLPSDFARVVEVDAIEEDDLSVHRYIQPSPTAPEDTLDELLCKIQYQQPAYTKATERLLDLLQDVSQA